MYFYLAMVGFEPTPTSTAAPSNTETTVIPSRPLRSLKKELSWPRFMIYIYRPKPRYKVSNHKRHNPHCFTSDAGNNRQRSGFGLK